MFSKLWLMNLILAAFAIFFGIKTHDVWVKKDKAVSETQTIQKTENRQNERRFLKKDIPAESAYKAIAEKNLFSPDRAEYIPPEEPEPEKEEVKPLLLSGQKITLYGVIIMDGYKSALISNPIREPGERENKWVKEGDMLGELKINAIQKESILLTEKDKKYEILLHDAQKPALKNESVKQEATAPTVVISESEKKQPAAPAVSKDQPAALSEDEYETVTTPFGTFKRKKK